MSKKEPWWVTPAIIGFCFLWAIAIGGVAFVAIHFVTKFW